MSDIAQDLLQIHAHLESERSTFESHWAEVAPLVLTRQDDFFSASKTEGERRTEQKVDDTASLALERFAAAMESVLTPRGQRWQRILPKNRDLLANPKVEQFCENLTEKLFRIRYSGESGFATQQHECYISQGAFGNSILAVEDMVGDGIRYKSNHIGEHCFVQNAQGMIDGTYRKFRLTARQAMQKFADNPPKCAIKAIEKTPGQKHDYLHVVIPDEEGKDPMRPFASYYISCEDGELLGRGGYHSFPYIIARYMTAPNETYGRSPAMTVLGEIKMIQKIRMTDLKARHMAADPPKLAASRATLRGKYIHKPSVINYGALDDNGNPLVKPYMSGVSVPASKDTLDESRRFINDAFLVTLFQILVETPQMTATEALMRAQEKGALLAPTMGRYQTEGLSPMTEREIAILDAYGTFADDGELPMPDELKDEDGKLDLEYTSPLSRLMRQEDALATQKTIESLIPIAQFDPSIIQRVNWSEYADIMREAHGAPSTLYYSKEEFAAMQQAQAEQQQQQAAMEAAPQIAGAIKDIAQAQGMAQ